MQQHVISKLSHISLRCVTLHNAMPGYTMACCVMPCYGVLCCAMLCQGMLCYPVPFKYLRAIQQGQVNMHLGNRL